MTSDEVILDASSEEEAKDKKNKVKKAFENNIANITAVLGTEPSKKRRKVPETDLDKIVGELFKEEDEELQKNLRGQLKELLTKYVNLFEELDKKRKEVDQLEETKMKEFNDAASKIWRQIDNMPARLRKFAEAFKAASAAGEKKETP